MVAAKSDRFSQWGEFENDFCIPRRVLAPLILADLAGNFVIPKLSQVIYHNRTGISLTRPNEMNVKHNTLTSFFLIYGGGRENQAERSPTQRSLQKI